MLGLKRAPVVTGGAAPCWERQVGDHPSALAISRNGARVAVGMLSGELQLCDAATGAESARWQAHASGLNCAAFGETLLASGGHDGHLRLWSTVSGERVGEISLGRSWVEHLAWSADGRWLAAAAGRAVAICDDSGCERYRHLHDAPVRALGFSPNGGLLALAGSGGAALLRTVDGQLDRRLPNRSPLLSLAWSPDGRVLACGTGDNEVRFWRLGGSDSQMSGFQGPPFRAIALAWCGSTLATGGDSSIALWKFSGRGPEGKAPDLLGGHLDLITHLASSADGRRLASAARDRTLLLAELRARDANVQIASLKDEPCALAWHPHKPRIYVADASGRVAAYDAGA